VAKTAANSTTAVSVQKSAEANPHMEIARTPCSPKQESKGDRSASIAIQAGKNAEK
jgi:hypothetical protein